MIASKDTIPPYSVKLRTLIYVCAGYTLVAGLVSFLGWVLDIRRLTAWEGTISIQPNTALVAAGAGVGLFLLGARARVGASIWGGIVALAGMLNLIQHATGADLGIDRLIQFGRSWGTAGTVVPGRIGLPASISWTLLGSAMVLAAMGRPGLRRVAATFAIIASLIALLSIVGYLYGANTIYSLPGYTAIAFQTATMALACAFGVMAAIPDQPPARNLLEHSSAGLLARRALPLIILVPIVVGLLRMAGSEAGLYDAAFGTALRTIVEVALMMGMLWLAVRMIRAHEGQLRESEEFNRRIIESSHDCIKVLDLEGRLLSINAQGRKLFCIPDPQPYLNQPWTDFWKGPHQEAAKKAVGDAAGGGVGQFVGFLPTLEGEPKWWDVTVSPMIDAQGRPERLLAISRDVTAQQAAGHALRESERRFHEMINAIPAAIYTTDASGRLTYFNPAAVEFCGRLPELGKDHWCVTWKLYHPDGTAMRHDECPMARTLKEGRPVRGAEAIAERPDGKRIWFRPYPTPLFNESGKVVGGINMLVDISDHKRNENAAARLAAIVESSDDAIVSKNLNGIVSSWNRAAERIFGYTSEEAVGRHISFIIPQERLGEEDEVLRRLRRGEKIDHFETERQTKDGRRVHISLTVSPIRDANGVVVGASKIARDITEKHRIEAELRLHRERLQELLDQRTRELEASHQRLRIAERLASLGTLSAGLGHDMGNLLVPIRLRLESLAGEILTPTALEDVKAIRTSADYLQKLAAGLRLLALDPGRTAPDESTELHAWWAEAEGVCRSVLPRGVPLESELPEGAVWVAISKPALTQAVFNLIQNAGDVLRDRKEGTVSLRAQVEGEQLRVSVADNGPGMTAEVRRRCLEPFFTTKHRGISTGLGLALVHGFVQDAGGQVEIESEAGSGTTVSLILPTADAASASAAGPIRRAVLDVADPRLRSFIAAELQSLKYELNGEAEGAELFVVDNTAKLGEIPSDSTIVLVGPSGGAEKWANIRVLGEKPQIRDVRGALRDLGRLAPAARPHAGGEPTVVGGAGGST